MYSAIEISIAACLASVAIVLFLYLSKLILFPIKEFARRYKQNLRTKQAAQRLEYIDKLIEEGNIREAIKQLRFAVLLDYVPNQIIINSIAEHHANMLSRCLTIAELTESRPLQIAEVERLLMQRAELHLLLLKAEESFRSIQSRRMKAGKTLPEWSAADFKARIFEINKELQKNYLELGSSLEKFFSSLGQPSSDSVVYH